MKKRMISICLVFFMCLSLNVPVFAKSIETVGSQMDFDRQRCKEEIINTLNFIEPQKNLFGLEDTDFSNIMIGKMIHTYEYSNGSLYEIDGLYPLFDEESIIAFAMPLDDNNFSISTDLTGKISSNISEDENIALLYDAYSCYLYNGTEYILLVENTEEASTRSAFPNDLNNLNIDNVILTN